MKNMLTNKILTGLPDADFARLMPLLEPVSLAVGERLGGGYDVPRYFYFPEGSVVSCHADMHDGKSAEVAMVGFDGVVGLPALLGSNRAPHSTNVSVAGTALRVRRDEFERELQQSAALRDSLIAYAGEYMTQVSQRAACAVLHRMEQRMAVWLLLLRDRLESDTVEITQERIAQYLGARRAGVTEIACSLQRAGAISYTRGHLRIADRGALRAVACECYSAMSGAGREQSVR
ncbi:MAG TPA: Crp/Fnr family transcriptional regulator [Pyrinomonadaceae bacterium]|nr:Crp/Fnr family transcriptional regulator [Pyrinomonadaceae bacterium]